MDTAPGSCWAMFVGALERMRLHGCPDPFQSLRTHITHPHAGMVMGPSYACWGMGDENWSRMSVLSWQQSTGKGSCLE